MTTRWKRCWTWERQEVFINCLNIERSSGNHHLKASWTLRTASVVKNISGAWDGEGVRSSRGCSSICHIAFRYTIKQVTCVAVTHTLVTNHAEAQWSAPLGSLIHPPGVPHATELGHFCIVSVMGNIIEERIHPINHQQVEDWKSLG